MKLKDMISNLKAQFRECAIAALADIDPHGKVQDQLVKEGWQFKNSMSSEEVKDFVLKAGAFSPVPYVPLMVKVISPEGKEVFTPERDEPLEIRYQQARRTAAHQIYGNKF